MTNHYFLELFITGLEVFHKFAKGPPAKCFQHDINEGFVGQYTYLKPQWSNQRSEAASSFKVVCRDKEDKTVDVTNLNKGIRGKYMYLIPVADDNKLKITQIQLTKNILEDMDECININEERKGRALYLSWNVEKIGISFRNFLI